MGGQPDIAHYPETDVLARLFLQGLVERDGVLVDLPHRIAHVEQRQQPGSVPRGSAGELPAFEQHRIAPSLLCQVIEGAGADDAPTDDDDPGLCLHGVALLSLLESVSAVFRASRPAARERRAECAGVRVPAMSKRRGPMPCAVSPGALPWLLP